MKHAVALALAALVAIAAFVFGAMYLHDERAAITAERVATERARDEAKQHLEQVRSEKASLDTATSQAAQQASSLNAAVEASQRADRARAERTKRAGRIANALAAAQLAKVATAEHYQSSLQWPTHNQEAGLPPPESFRNDVVRSITVEKHASTTRIRVRYVEEGGERELQLLASVNQAFAFSWQCISNDTPDIQELASGCSYRAK
jgi:Pilin (bacterial filament)